VTTPVPAARRWPARTRSRLSAVLAASVLASLFAFGATGAQPARVAAMDSPWYQIEVYYLGLVNCTRTGGWVQADGRCSGYGSGKYSKYVAPLALGPKLSNVARRWAKYLATTDQCKHGDPGARLRAAGLYGWTWGENIGCGWAMDGVKASVLASHRMMQAEKPTGGGHWKNIKNASFKRVGIGIWKANGRVRVVSDFYTPRG